MRPLLCLVPIIASLAVLNAADGPIRPLAAPHQPEASIRVNVNMALVPVTVVDNLGRNVTGLSQENFRVIDGSQPRPIASFSREDQPVSVGLVFDCSASMRDKFPAARQAPVELFKQLNDGDESLLVTVSDDAVLRHGLTSGLEDIQNALVFISPKGTTSLVDGVYLGLAQLKKAHNARRALIVISDGGDNNSRYTLNDLTKVAMEADTRIFTIGLHDNPKTTEELHGPELMENLSRASGGIDYVIRDMNGIGDVMARIGIMMHNEYVLGFYPPSDAPKGKYRKIKVQLLLPRGLPALHVFARSGYYAPD
jgi:Ca-activated chloride channel family protein